MIVGGVRGSTKLTETLIYNLGTNTWRRGPAIPESSASGTVSGDMLWRDFPEIDWLFLQPHAESYGDGLIFLGGGSSVLQYDPVKERFAIRPEASMPGAFGTIARGKLCVKF